MPRFNPLELNGFAEAVWQERLVRDVAFLQMTYDLAGYTVREMTLPDYLVLRMAGNAAVDRRTPSVEEMAAFLWLLSPGYSRSEKARRKFYRRCREFCAPERPWLVLLWPPRRGSFTRGIQARWLRRKRRALRRAAEVSRAMDRFVEETLQDRPAGREVRGFAPSYYSDAVYWCALLGRAYGWPLREILAMPLKQLFGFVVEIHEHHDPKAPKTNPSDRIRARWLEEQNRKLLEKDAAARRACQN